MPAGRAGRTDASAIFARTPRTPDGAVAGVRAKSFMQRPSASRRRGDQAHAPHQSAPTFSYQAREPEGTHRRRAQTLRSDVGHLPRLCLADDRRALRRVGFACRFVTGYVSTTPAARSSRWRLGRSTGSGATHAWLPVYLAGRRLAALRPDQLRLRRHRPDPGRRSPAIRRRRSLCLVRGSAMWAISSACP